tara:strand:- start:877 stop:1500 length:624 start_codon:yes stop_codon:yes gene_type:complete
MIVDKKNKFLFLKSSAILGILLFFLYLIYDLGVLSLIINSDKSRISIVILSIYFLATIHWYVLSYSLNKQIEDAYAYEGPFSSFFINGDKSNDNTSKTDSLLSIMEDELSNKHALGYMTVDILLKLGLTGTVIGFILMLLPIGEIKDFDTQIIQQLLSKMSGGMAVALYTTLTGLITSVLLKLQYFLLDSSLTSLMNYLSSRILDEK